MWNSVDSFRRIRITEKDDIEALYPLISAYINQPSLADSVTELVIDSGGWPTRRPMFGAPTKLTFPINEDAHTAMLLYVGSFGLGEEMTSTMLRDLEWKKKQLSGEDPGTPDDHKHNFAFAITASIALLSLCKNITTLYLGRVGRGALEKYLLKSNYGLIPNPGLQQLERVEIIRQGDWSDDERVYDTIEFLDNFRYIHRLPAIESIEMEGVAAYQSYRDLFVPQSSNIKKMRIGHADIPSSLIGTIIRIPRGLEEFSLSLGGLWSIDGGHSQVYTKTIGKALLEQKETLRVLDLDIDADLLGYDNPRTENGRRHEGEDGTREEDLEKYDGHRNKMYMNADGYFRLDRQISSSPLWTAGLPDTRKYGYTIGSLHDFTALTHLSIGIKALMGYRGLNGPPCLAEQPPFRFIDALPPKLEYFCLYGYTKGEIPDIDEHVEELMEKKSERLPLLRELKGIDELVEDVATAYADVEEDDLWEKPMKNLDWVKA
ncbi:Fc.00g027240.m01.CDS01 [Cosmosporella sp. VM-42]